MAERASAHIYARGDFPLGMPRSARVQAPETFEIFQRQVVAGEVELGIKQHARVTAGEYEPIPSDPIGVVRVVANVLVKQEIGYWRQGESGTGVA